MIMIYRILKLSEDIISGTLEMRRATKYKKEKHRTAFSNKIIQRIYKDYKIVINNYNKRKDYLKYF